MKKGLSDLLLDIKKGKTAYEKYEQFERIARLCEWFAQITSESLTSLFLKSDESNLLTSLFCKERREWIAHDRS